MQVEVAVVHGLMVYRYKQKFFSDGCAYPVDTYMNGCIIPHLVPIQLLVERMQSRANDNEL